MADIGDRIPLAAHNSRNKETSRLNAANYSTTFKGSIGNKIAPNKSRSLTNKLRFIILRS